MKTNTRFNPTTNGNLHLGHLFMILVNIAEARKVSGKFIFRFDDNQRYWLDKIGEPETKAIKHRMIEDLAFMELFPDEYISQEEIEPNVRFSLEKRMKDKAIILSGQYMHDQVPETLKPFTYYPYTPLYTLEKVWMDFIENVRLLIRGEDLITEFSLYNYFVDLLGLPRVTHIYIPRLRLLNEDLSKTVGNYQVQHLRSVGIRRDEILNVLALSCLRNPLNDFTINNLLSDPTLRTDILEKYLTRKSKDTNIE